MMTFKKLNTDILSYNLNAEGQCLEISPYFIINNNDFYSLWGIITMAVLSASILASLLFGRKYLLNLSYAQTFLILVFWTPGVSKDLEVFVSWLQFSKLDLGYLYYSGLGSVFNCVTESIKMANLQFGCQSFVLNYFWVLTIFIVLFGIYRLLDAVGREITIIRWIVNQINNRFPSSLTMWVFIHLFYRLMLINIHSNEFEPDTQYINLKYNQGG